jgi:hypothetical protein
MSDIDHDLSFNDACSRCVRFGIQPCFAYSTFNAVDNERFRMAFLLPYVIEDKRLRNIVAQALLVFFPECDKNCADPSRLFYGGKKLLLEDYDQTIDIPGLIEGMCEYLFTEDPQHAARKLSNYCKITGVQLTNGLPAIELIDSGEYITSPVINSTRLAGNSPLANQSILIHYNPNMHTLITENGGPRELIRNFDWDDLETNCQLYKEFKNNIRSLDHNERFGLATNLLCIQGGEKIFKESLMLRIDYDKPKWRGTVTYIKKKAYLPKQCNKYCPYADSCEHDKNLIGTTKLPRGMIRVIKDPICRPLEEVEQELLEIWDQTFLKTNDHKVHVIKAPTGIGKTELYLPLTGTVIAVPTHRLQKEIAKRMDEKGNHDYLLTPELPELSSADKAILDHYYAVGAYKEATKYIYHLANTGNVKVQKYVDILDEIKRNMDNKTIITTHARLLYMETRCDKIIIDEDILSELIQQKTVLLRDLGKIAKRLKGTNLKIMNSFIDYFEKAQELLVFPIPLGGGDGDRIKKIAINSPDITTNVLGLFGATHFLRSVANGENVIHYVTRRELPKDKTYIILSATASEEIYKLLFGDQLVFHDLGYAMVQGRLHQYPERSYSREVIRNDPKLLGKAKDIIGKNAKVITYKEFEDNFEHTVAHFHALKGLDELGGNDLAIIGTPNSNPFSYLLIASALGVRLGGFEDNNLKYRKVSNANHEFYFNTFDNNKTLRDIQFSYVESELQQAIGRARLIRNDVTVTLFSNYPVPGAEFRYLPEDQTSKVLELRQH